MKHKRRRYNITITEIHRKALDLYMERAVETSFSRAIEQAIESLCPDEYKEVKAQYVAPRPAQAHRPSPQAEYEAQQQAKDAAQTEEAVQVEPRTANPLAQRIEHDPFPGKTWAEITKVSDEGNELTLYTWRSPTETHRILPIMVITGQAEVTKFKREILGLGPHADAEDSDEAKVEMLKHAYAHGAPSGLLQEFCERTGMPARHLSLDAKRRAEAISEADVDDEG